MTAADTPPRAVLLCDGPLAGQGFTHEDFAVRWHAADRIARTGGMRGPALDYRAAGEGDWHKVPADLPEPLRAYAVTPLVWAGTEADAQRWRDATSAAIHAAARAGGEHDEH